MPRYVNKQPFDVYLPGPSGEKVRIKRNQTITLPDFFDKYVPRGYLRRLDVQAAVVEKPNSKLKRQIKQVRLTTKVVGRPTTVNVQPEFAALIDVNKHPISNGIGVGIMSYNRRHSLERLVNSIRKYTDLGHTTVFISDDGSDQDLKQYLAYLSTHGDITVLQNNDNVGVAGNSNRLLRCLERFKHKIILNDDVEILSKGWESFYFDAMDKTDYHHFCQRQPGVYGAELGEKTKVGNTVLFKTIEKPHGAVMAFDHAAFEKVGYFDEGFGQYGYEHVDWSTRVSRSGLQPVGFYDVEGSHTYFRVHSDVSAVEDRPACLKRARQHQPPTDRVHVKPTLASVVPAITCIIPFRDIGRSEAISLVIDNIRAQRYPSVEIIAVEEDDTSKLTLNWPINHLFVKSNTAFNKSAAFNAAVAESCNENIVLHDADMLVQGDYFKMVANVLSTHESCILASHVYYLDDNYSAQVIAKRAVDARVQCQRRIDYFEGGSLACTKSAYWKIGGFNEEYVGYGCEDTDFYARLSGGSKWLEDRQIGLIHLAHPRTDGWTGFHDNNKAIEKNLLQLTVAQRIERQRASLKSSKYSHLL